MTFDQAVVSGLRKYADFSGRALRSEYWWFQVFYLAVAWVAAIISETLWLLVFLGLVLPNLAVAVRRLHDRGKSGWFLLVGFIPIVGNIWLLVEMASRGDEGPNRFGPPPGVGVAAGDLEA